MTLCLAWSISNPRWVEVREGEEVLEEIEVLFPLRRLPALSFSSSYQRLESKKCNPSLKILSRIKKIFPEFSIDYALGC